MSSSNAQGGTTITIQFTLTRDIDAATQDVQAAVAKAFLPANMPRPPSVQKTNPSMQPILYLSLNSSTLPLYTVDEYAEVTRIVDANRKSLPRGSFVTVRGQLQTMRDSYLGLLGGLVFSVVLVYLLIVVNFQSWLDPFIIITALPAALAGIVGFLFLTHTTLSVPALMGAVMCMGVGTANSILVVSFAKERLLHHGDPVEAAIEAGFTRFRPVLMTALVAALGFVPMAIATGTGAEVQKPIATVVIGGRVTATLLTLVVLPALYKRFVFVAATVPDLQQTKEPTA